MVVVDEGRLHNPQLDPYLRDRVQQQCGVIFVGRVLPAPTVMVLDERTAISVCTAEHLIDEASVQAFASLLLKEMARHDKMWVLIQVDPASSSSSSSSSSSASSAPSSSSSSSSPHHRAQDRSLQRKAEQLFLQQEAEKRMERLHQLQVSLSVMNRIRPVIVRHVFTAEDVGVWLSAAIDDAARTSPSAGENDGGSAHILARDYFVEGETTHEQFLTSATQ